MPGTSRYLLVDGHSVIFHLPYLCHLHRNNPRKAREELRHSLEHLHDSSHWRVTLVYDGAGSKPDASREPRSMAIIYSAQGQTADSIIEQIVASQVDRDAILVVTADEAERQTVEALGANCTSPEWLEGEISAQDASFRQRLEQINRSQRW